MYNTIKTELKENVMIITVNRPDKMNALNKEVKEELGKAIENVYNDKNIKAAILTGAGEKAFVAGADISEFDELDSKGGALLAKKGQEFVFDRIENSPKPIIAAVNGFALGGGCELAMACHFRTASDRAKFGQPEVNLGLIPGYGGTQRLVQLVGKGRAMELLMSAEMISAETAKNYGLVNHVFPAEELLDKTMVLVQKITTKAPFAIQKIIELANEAATVSKKGFENEVKAFGACFDTEDKKEGTAAFMEKRAATFTGK